jgi:hypothetical protein
MLSLIIQITIVSIIFIFVIHYLINFFRDNLTVPKIKDLVNAPNKKYENMFNIIASHTAIPSPKYNDYDLLPTSSTTIASSALPQESMKDELKSFLKKQLQVSASSTDISTLASTSSSYSTY